MIFGGKPVISEGRFGHRIRTIDSHTAGEPTRLIVSGVPPLGGATMAERLVEFQERHDAIRKRLTREPRGHRDLLAALLTEPAEPGSDFGLIYMDARRYPFMCGHATIGAVSACFDVGWLTADGPERVVRVDTPSGTVETRAFISGDRVEAVAIRMVPAFVYETDQRLTVPGFGELRVATVCVGGFFVMVSADQIPFALSVENSRELIDLGMRVIDAANARLTVAHPLRPEVRTVDVVKFYDPSRHAEGESAGAVIYGERHMDRSPCGTGTAALLTLLLHQGHLAENVPFISKSPLGTTFDARIVETLPVGNIPGAVVEIRGTAHLTGIHEFLLDPDDPFPRGYLP